MAVAVGARATRDIRVEPDMSADRLGNTGVNVLSTPHLVGLFEGTAVKALAELLEPGQASVGTHVNIRHLKATRVGETITVTAEVVAVDGRKVHFQVRAEDPGGLAGEGTHERVIVDLERFLNKVYVGA